MEYMTIKEADRYAVVKAVKNKKINLKQGGKELCLSYSQMKRIWKRYVREGHQGLISKKRGKASNNQLSYKIRHQAIFLIKEKYYDYGPTLIKEKLEEKHHIKIGKETLRQLMIKKGIWKAKTKKYKKVYARRTRRSRYGELQQIDGSYHDWFEDRGDKCCLLVSVDDATSALTGLKFCKHETTYDYLDFLKTYIKSHGKPMAFYSDKHSVFRVNNKKKEGIANTKFQKVLKKLDIELICANSPQAKSRVERANGVLQDRLVKELREENISSIEEGNKYLEKFRIKYNKKFAIEPADFRNVHRKFLSSKIHETIFMIQEERKISKDLSFQYKSQIYQIESKYINRLAGKKIEIFDWNGEIQMVLCDDKKMKFKKYKEKFEPTKIVGVKELETLWPSYSRKPKKYHTWK